MTCQGVPLWHPIGKGCQNGAPLCLRCLLTCFGSSGIYISSLLSEAMEAMILSCFLAPQKWRVSNLSFACRGDVHGVPKRHPFRLRGVVLAPLNACRQGVTTRESRVIACRNFPKSKCLLFSSPPTISPKMVLSTSLSPYPAVIFWFG